MASHALHPAMLSREQAHQQIRLLERPHPQHDRLSLPLYHLFQLIRTPSRESAMLAEPRTSAADLQESAKVLNDENPFCSRRDYHPGLAVRPYALQRTASAACAVPRSILRTDSPPNSRSSRLGAPRLRDPQTIS